MGQVTGIEWTDATHNFWYGCQKVSPGCAHCYAERDMTRYGRNFAQVTRAKGFDAPLHWKEPRRIFVNSWSDFFIPEADRWRGQAWEVIRETPQHTYQILTKRPENIQVPWAKLRHPWRNVWLGVSVENQRWTSRIDLLRAVPATVRFLSLEPMLGPLQLDLTGIHWVIVGGESGPGARPMNPDWARDIRDQCLAAQVPFFFKQWGGTNKKAAGNVLDGRTWAEFPAQYTQEGAQGRKDRQ